MPILDGDVGAREGADLTHFNFACIKEDGSHVITQDDEVKRYFKFCPFCGKKLV